MFTDIINIANDTIMNESKIDYKFIISGRHFPPNSADFE